MTALETANNFPKLHNAMWPVVVGKDKDAPKPDDRPLNFERILDLTAQADVDGQKFEGVDLFIPMHEGLAQPGEVERLATQIGEKKLAVGSLVANVWGGCAFGNEEKRAAWLSAVREGCLIGKRFRDQGIRTSTVIRIDTSGGVEEYLADEKNNFERLVAILREAAQIAEDHGERLAAEGEICWGGMHSAGAMVRLLEGVDRKPIGFQADMAHTYLFVTSPNALGDAIAGPGADLNDPEFRIAAYRQVANRLRPWTIDFHVAQNDGGVFGSGTHAKTGKHCRVDDPDGKLDIVPYAGTWLRGANGLITRAFNHIVWDGCMQPTSLIDQQDTYNKILSAMLQIRAAHGWREEAKA